MWMSDKSLIQVGSSFKEYALIIWKNWVILTCISLFMIGKQEELADSLASLLLCFEDAEKCKS